MVPPDWRFSQGLHKPLQLYKAEFRWRDNNIIFWMEGETDALPCHFHISVSLPIMDLDRRVREKNTGFRDEMLLKATERFVQELHY